MVQHTLCRGPALHCTVVQKHRCAFETRVNRRAGDAQLVCLSAAPEVSVLLYWFTVRHAAAIRLTLLFLSILRAITSPRVLC
jgi:hypothetical protein